MINKFRIEAKKYTEVSEYTNAQCKIIRIILQFNCNCTLGAKS